MGLDWVLNHWRLTRPGILLRSRGNLREIIPLRVPEQKVLSVLCCAGNSLSHQRWRGRGHSYSCWRQWSILGSQGGSPAFIDLEWIPCLGRFFLDANPCSSWHSLVLVLAARICWRRSSYQSWTQTRRRDQDRFRSWWDSRRQFWIKCSDITRISCSSSCNYLDASILIYHKTN